MKQTMPTLLNTLRRMLLIESYVKVRCSLHEQRETRFKPKLNQETSSFLLREKAPHYLSIV